MMIMGNLIAVFLINFLKQSIALFTPLLVIFLFALLKKGGKGDVKEASLGKKCVKIIYCLLHYCIAYIYIDQSKIYYRIVVCFPVMFIWSKSF